MWLESDENYLRFDEKSNTYDSLGKLLFFLDNIKRESNFWKWAIIALHSALYGAMVLVLQGTHPDRVSQLPIKKKKTNTVDDNGKPTVIEITDRKLISFPEAFKRIQQPGYMKMYVGSNVFSPKHNHYEAIEWINDELRNPFLHFTPKNWSIGVKGLKEIFNSCLEIIEFCLFQSSNARLDDSERQKFEIVIKEIKHRKELSL